MRSWAARYTVDSGPQQLQTPAPQPSLRFSTLRDTVTPTRPQQSSVRVVMGLWAVNIFARNFEELLCARCTQRARRVAQEPNKGGGSSRFSGTNKETLRLAVVLG